MAQLNIVRRDLTRFYRNPLTTVLIFAMPLTMAGIFAVVFGGDGAAESISVRVLLYDEDESLLSKLMQSGASSPDLDQKLELVAVGEEGYQMMEEGEASALVHIPMGFTESFLSGTPVTLEVVKNPAQRFLPQLVEEGVSLGGVILSQLSLVFGPELQQLKGMMDANAAPADLKIAALSVAINQKATGIQQYVLPPIVDLETVTVGSDEDEESGISILSYFLPGMSILGILFMAQAASRDILLERETGLLRHLLTAPISVGQYLVGKCLSVFAVTGLGFAILVVVGLACGVSWGPPVAVLALVLASTLAAAGTMILIMSAVGSQRQGDALTGIVVIAWSLLGGSFVPLDAVPSFVLPISRTTLNYWAVDAFTELIQRGGGLADIVSNLAVLSGFGLLFLMAGAFLLRRRIVQGVV